MFSNCQLRNLTRFSPLRWSTASHQWKYVCDIIAPEPSSSEEQIELTQSGFDISLPGDTLPSSRSDRFSITTFNVLFDRNIRDAYEMPTIHSRERFLFALDRLRHLTSDIVCFQEVTPTFASIVMEQDWIKQDYFISYDDKSSCLEPYGQLTISRFPMSRVWSYQFGPLARKRVLLCDMLVNDRHLIVANVHLPADKFLSSGASAGILENRQRQGQLRRIVSLVQETADDHFVAGDFNFGDNDMFENRYLDESFLSDSWKLQHSLNKEPGFTFDPAGNELTHILCPSALAAQRIDRILFHSNLWKLGEIRLVLKDAFKVEGGADVSELHPSDHYGVHATFIMR